MQPFNVERVHPGPFSSGVNSLSGQVPDPLKQHSVYLSTIRTFFRSLYKALFTFTDLKIVPFLYSHRLLMQHKVISQL